MTDAQPAFKHIQTGAKVEPFLQRRQKFGRPDELNITIDGAPVTLDEALTQYGAALLERGGGSTTRNGRAIICPTRCCRSRSR